jgi:rhodanese-related sulfurtransferase
VKRFLIYAVTLLVLGAIAAAWYSQRLGWRLINAKIQADFPEVRRTTTDELAAALATRNKPVLLDVRTKAEFDVSHLEGAIRVEPGSGPAAISIPKDQPIVTYCSVGYRSAAFAKKLGEAGYRNGTNLEGSIFRWANENRPLVHEGQPTDKVHPYNRLWGILLDKSHRAMLPEK